MAVVVRCCLLWRSLSRFLCHRVALDDGFVFVFCLMQYAVWCVTTSFIRDGANGAQNSGTQERKNDTREESIKVYVGISTLTCRELLLYATYQREAMSLILREYVETVGQLVLRFSNSSPTKASTAKNANKTLVTAVILDRHYLVIGGQFVPLFWITVCRISTVVAQM